MLQLSDEIDLAFCAQCDWYVGGRMKNYWEIIGFMRCPQRTAAGQFDGKFYAVVTKSLDEVGGIVVSFGYYDVLVEGEGDFPVHEFSDDKEYDYSKMKGILSQYGFHCEYF